MTSALGLRERKKVATREALHQAAVRLAAEHGVDNVTVEAIADAATVSRRTFSKYFASKEQALLHADQTRVAHLIDLVRGRPPAESPWTALTRATEEWLAEPPTGDPQTTDRYRELRRHPTLLAEQVATYAAAERELTSAIAERIPSGPGAGLRARLLAANFLSTLRVAHQVWLDPPARTLPRLVREALALAAESFT